MTAEFHHEHELCCRSLRQLRARAATQEKLNSTFTEEKCKVTAASGTLVKMDDNGSSRNRRSTIVSDASTQLISSFGKQTLAVDVPKLKSAGRLSRSTRLEMIVVRATVFP